MLVVTKVVDPQLAVKLIDFVCSLAADFWARDSCGRHVIMNACYEGVHPSVLLRLVKWARRCSPNVALPMSQQDADGLDAVELAIHSGHGELASCLLEQQDPATHSRLLCVHYPLVVLELAIESMDEQCARDVLANKRVMNHLRPGKAERLNLIARWTQRQTPSKRLYNIFTCVGAAVRCEMPSIVQSIFKINPDETRRAVWYAVYKLQVRASVTPAHEVQRMARSYLLNKLWSQISAIVLLRHHELLARHEHTCSLYERIRRWRLYERRDWDAIASHPWTTVPSDVFSRILSFLLPSESEEARSTASMVEF
ncbi:hypothetical protein PR001_g7673 [Phytophthora rubi]|uniref:Uncharacterized protein n=1 Tax=Phytophthora rubi TaxID=129364 RepID=A0A6A3MUD6_9STRA|nr:hypothetical protein PR002_g7974 [Phytophthora rubi]KAE9039088.1 hypothetical protein PR001_g7673 [Phytophthora rubi]